MSFGFGMSDFFAVARLAKSVYESCKTGPQEYQELCNEVQSLRYALEGLSHDARDPSSILARKGQHRKGELDAIVENCKSTMNGLQTMIDKHSSLRSDNKANIARVWNAYQVGSSDLDSYRGKLTFHTSTISVFLLSLQGSAMSRIEKKLDIIYERMLRDDIAQARYSSASLGSTVPILSGIDMFYQQSQQFQRLSPSRDDMAQMELYERQPKTSYQPNQETQAQHILLDQTYREMMELLVTDYQSATCIEGAEKMLKRARDKLHKSQKQNEILQSERKTAKWEALEQTYQKRIVGKKTVTALYTDLTFMYSYSLHPVSLLDN